MFAAYDFARQIAGDNANVHMLVSPGADIHSYDPSPKDMLAVSKCDVFIYIGGESDAWVDEILSAAENPDMTVIKLVDYTEGLICSDHSHDHGNDDHDHGEYDEHVWTNPKNASLACDAIASALCRIDGDNADEYTSNLNSYKTELAELDAEFRAIVSGGARKELVFGDRFPFIYFTEAYGLEYSAAFPGCADDTEPSAATIAALINKVNSENIPVVIYLSLSTGNIAQTICESTGAVKMQFNTCANISKDDFDTGVTYIELMRKNAQVLREALK
jgi:zinc transport system substrate-binding protein